MKVKRFTNGVRKTAGAMTIIKDYDLGFCRLLSYGSVILEVDLDGRLLFLGNKYNYSKTTSRHISIFLNEVQLNVQGKRVCVKKDLDTLVKNNIIEVDKLYKY